MKLVLGWVRLAAIALVLLALAAPARGLAAPAPLTRAASPAELIAAVNAYRAANGLEPYGVDGYLMGEAQSHSEYMASIKQCTHDRADGSGPGDHGISAENVACGINLSVEGAIYRQWVDPLHSATILGPDTGLVGAGMAVSGNMIFYTLAVKRLSGNFEYRPPAPTLEATLAPGSPTRTPVPTRPAISPLLTATPQDDGAIRHTIRYGQTLIAIAGAYGLTLDVLLAQNPHINAQSYFEGQVLIIRAAFTPTVTPSQTLTPRPPTRTPTSTRTATRTPAPTDTPTPLPSPTATPWLILPGGQAAGWNRPTLGYLVIGASALGVLLVLARGFLRVKR